MGGDDQIRARGQEWNKWGPRAMQYESMVRLGAGRAATSGIQDVTSDIWQCIMNVSSYVFSSQGGR
jgi:hypothetical protein